MESIEAAHKLIKQSNMSIDVVLKHYNLTYRKYRKVYPESPVTPTLALNILDARDLEGLTNKQIQRRWSLSNSQLHYALYNDASIIPKTSDYELPRMRIINELSNSNKSQTEIAEEYGVSQSLVHKIAKENGLLPKNRKKRKVLTKEQKDFIVLAVEDGEAVEDLAKEYGVSRDTIYKHLRSVR